MTLESFAAELKKARVEKQISLMDISASTRINLKFLEALEEGNFSLLPQTYVRAFIREYADAVGYNVQEAMKQYDALTRPRPAEKPEGAPSPTGVRHDQPPAEENRILGFARQNAVFIGIIIVVAVFVVYLTRPVADNAPGSDVAETPFDKVVQENQAAAPVKQQEPVALPSVSRLVGATDSLTLDMTTADSVWMTITLDGDRTHEYLFPPSRKGSWKAKKSFTVTMGNAGGASFTLNGHELGALGKRGAVVRNILISEANLPKQ